MYDEAMIQASEKSVYLHVVPLCDILHDVKFITTCIN